LRSSCESSLAAGRKGLRPFRSFSLPPGFSRIAVLLSSHVRHIPHPSPAQTAPLIKAAASDEAMGSSPRAKRRAGQQSEELKTFTLFEAYAGSREQPRSGKSKKQHALTGGHSRCLLRQCLQPRVLTPRKDRLEILRYITRSSFAMSPPPESGPARLVPELHTAPRGLRARGRTAA
jgi:hypothetical protein